MDYSGSNSSKGGLFSALYKFNVYAFISYMGYYGYDASGLDMIAIIDNPSSVDWSMFGAATARMADAFAADVRGIVMGPVKDFALGFAQATGLTGLDFSQPKSLADIADDVRSLPIVRVAYGS